MNDTAKLELKFLHPRSDDVYEATVETTATGRAIIEQLREEKWLPDPGRSAFALALKDRSLDLDKPLVAQDVTSGSTIHILLPGVGAGTEEP